MNFLKKLICYILLIMIWSVGPVSANPQPLKLFILAGQSNMVGYSSDLNQLPPSLPEIQTNVLWYNRFNQWVALTAPTEPLPFSGKLQNRAGFGPEITLGQKIAASIESKVAIVKYAQNGTNLAVQWQPSGILHNGMLKRVNNGINALKELGYQDIEIAGFFWMQGESDAKSVNMSARYQANLSNFMTQIRRDFNNPSLPFIYGKIAVINGQLTSFGTFCCGDTVREAQDSLHGELNRVVETIDLPRIEDNLHLDSSGLLTLGDRFGEAWLKSQNYPELSLVTNLERRE